MNSRAPAFLVLLLAALSGAAQEGPATLYARGMPLIRPCLVLSTTPAADPTTPEGHSDLQEGIGLLTLPVVEMGPLTHDANTFD